MSETHAEPQANGGETNPEDWPKRFEPGTPVPDELRQNDKVVLVETVPLNQSGDPNSQEPTIVAHHEDYSPSTWIRVDGVDRADLAREAKYSAAEAIRTALDPTGAVSTVAWFSDQEVTVSTLGGKDPEITASDVGSALKVLEHLREEFREDMMIGEARRMNEAHAMIQEHSSVDPWETDS